LHGAHYTLDPTITTYAYLNRYTVSSDYGPFVAPSDARLRRLLREIAAIAELKARRRPLVVVTKALVKGVEQCFNPSHTKGNTAAKNRLIKLEKTALSAKSGLTSGEAPKLAQTAAELEAQWQAFFEKAPIAARFHCDTQRRCMELGFEGHPNYPHCQPVNGNKHANIQYIQFQQSLRVLPQLLADLNPQADGG
jgi:hypothetical protein